MSERITQPSDADKLNWNDDGVTYPPATPNAAKRLTGFKPLNVPAPGPGEIVTADEQNFLHGLTGQMEQYFLDYLVREWDQIAQGISAGSYKDLFRVTPPLGSVMSIRLAERFSLTGTAATGGAVTNVIGDGERVYYVSGNASQSVIAANPANGTEIWESSPVTQALTLEADGLFVYTSAGVGQPGLRKINRDTGATAGNAGSEYAMTALRANGVFCVGIAPASDSGAVVFYTVATPIETGVAAVTSQLNALAIDETQCYVGGVRNTEDVWGINLNSRAEVWATALDTNEPVVNAICTDGNNVYVCTDSFVTALPGTPNRSLFCLDRLFGTVLWSIDFGANLDRCAIDGDYLYVVTDAGVVFASSLRGAESSGAVATQTNCASSIYVDGVSLYCQDGAASTNLRRLSMAQTSKGFMVVNGADPARRPFFNLAIPINNG